MCPSLAWPLKYSCVRGDGKKGFSLKRIRIKKLTKGKERYRKMLKVKNLVQKENSIPLYKTTLSTKYNCCVHIIKSLGLDVFKVQVCPLWGRGDMTTFSPQFVGKFEL